MRELLRSNYQSILDYFRSPANRVASIAIIVVVLANIIQAVIRAAVHNFADLNFFLDPAIGMRFFEQDPFTAWPDNSYTSFFYAVMSLLTPFDRWFSAFIWAVLNSGFYVWVIVLVNELIKESQPERKKWSYFMAPLLTLILLAINIHLGQSNILMMLAILLSMYYLKKGNNIKTGLALGFAIAYKVTPLIFLPFLILKGKFRAAICSVAFTVVFMVLVPMLFYSPERSVSFVRSWSEMVFEPFFSGEKVKSTNVNYYHSNQSLDAFLNRHFTPYGAEKYDGLHSWLNPDFFTEVQVGKASKLIKLFLVALIGFLAIKNRSIDKRTFPFEVSLFMMAILFISPVSWVNHYILVLPAYIIAVNEVIILPKWHSGRKLLLWSMILGTSIMHIGWGNYLQSLSPFFIGQGTFFICFYVYTFLYAAKPIKAE